MKKRFILLALVVGILITLSGCYGAGGGNTAQSPAAQQEKNTVIIKDFKFAPQTLTINKGETVTWINQDKAAHTATGKTFDSGNLNTDGRFTFTFNENGTFDYICTYHPYMKGQVIVK